MIPEKDDLFIPFGNYDECVEIIKSGVFFPTLLSGPTGIGKTYQIEQACANCNREYFRLNVNFETNEDDFCGGLRLLNGNTYFEKGPVIEAMEKGAVLLYDEIDAANTLFVFSQHSIFEGKGYLIKKTGEWIKPKNGFQIFATANTKGIGDSTGNYIGTQILNEAFLDRIGVTLECFYPNKQTERLILETLANHLNINIDESMDYFINNLLSFANKIRETYEKGAIEVNISTRRLAHILRGYAIFKDYKKAFQNCLNRYERSVQLALSDTFEFYHDWTKFSAKSTSDIEIIMDSWKPW